MCCWPVRPATFAFGCPILSTGRNCADWSGNGNRNWPGPVLDRVVRRPCGCRRRWLLSRIGRSAEDLVEEVLRYTRIDGVPQRGERLILLPSMVHVLGLVAGLLYGLHAGVELVPPARLTGDAIVQAIGSASTPATVLGVPVPYRAARVGTGSAVVAAVQADDDRLGRPRPDLRHSFALPPDVAATNIVDMVTEAHSAVPGPSAVAAHTASGFDPALAWSDLEWLRRASELPLVVKGGFSTHRMPGGPSIWAWTAWWPRTMAGVSWMAHQPRSMRSNRLSMPSAITAPCCSMVECGAESTW